MSQNLSTYAIASLFINRNKMDVTKDKLESLFKAIKQEYLPKVGENYLISGDKYENLLSFTAAAPTASNVVAEAPVEVKEEVAEEDVDIDFDFF